MGVLISKIKELAEATDEPLWDVLIDINAKGDNDDFLEINDFRNAPEWEIDEVRTHLHIPEEDPTQVAALVFAHISDWLPGEVADGREELHKITYAGDSLSNNTEDMYTPVGQGYDYIIPGGIAASGGFKPEDAGTFGWEKPFIVDIKKVREVGWAPLTYFSEMLERDVIWYTIFGSGYDNKGVAKNKGAPFQIMTLTGGTLTQWVVPTGKWEDSSLDIAKDKFLPSDVSPMDKLSEMLSKDTDAFIMWLGHNDILQGSIIAGVYDKAKYIEALERMLDLVHKKATHARPVVILPLDVTLLFERSKVERVAAETKDGRELVLQYPYTIKPFKNEDEVPKQLALTKDELEAVKQRWQAAGEAMKNHAEARGAVVIDVNYMIKDQVENLKTDEIWSADGFHPNDKSRVLLEMAIINELKKNHFAVDFNDNYIRRAAETLEIPAEELKQLLKSGNPALLVKRVTFPKHEGPDELEGLMQKILGKISNP